MDLEMLKRMLADLEENPGGEMDEGHPEEPEEGPEGIVLDIGVRPLQERDEDLLSAFSEEENPDDGLGMFRRSKKRAAPSA